MEGFFSPRSVAIIGASSDKHSVGFSLFKNAVNSGLRVFPVNPNHSSINGVVCYSSVLALKSIPDVAVVAVPSLVVPSVLEECGLLGVKNVIIISAGFSEVGNVELSDKVKSIISKYKLKVLGPNCLGVITPKLNLSFFDGKVLGGDVVFVSQSGALGTGLIDYLSSFGLGFRAFISLGNMFNTSFTDVINHFSGAKLFVLYVESFRDGLKLLRACKDENVVILAGGLTKSGSKAVSTHTASLGSNVNILNGVFKQFGVVKAESLSDVVGLVKSFHSRPKGSNALVVSNAGGLLVLAVDALSGNGFNIVKSVDLLGDATPEKFKSFFSSVKGFDFSVLLLTPQSVTDILGISKEFVSFVKRSHKPGFAILLGGDSVSKGVKFLEENNIPVFSDPLILSRIISLLNSGN